MVPLCGFVLDLGMVSILAMSEEEVAACCFGDLIDIREFPGIGQDIYIRMASSELAWPLDGKFLLVVRYAWLKLSLSTRRHGMLYFLLGGPIMQQDRILDWVVLFEMQAILSSVDHLIIVIYCQH
ncbi:hypothetical protein F0562_019665 [Nyssa sinensis]|uniref:Uncharacterized protein n=1 Tax=Nyssa sinensis TaxID=561372 RepID=A0A5J5BS96_9ASTE|nr:hypothetical protein F0562_019665 [Nyssa sinensis]